MHLHLFSLLPQNPSLHERSRRLEYSHLVPALAVFVFVFFTLPFVQVVVLEAFALSDPLHSLLHRDQRALCKFLVQ